MSSPFTKKRARICPGCGTLLDPSDSRCYRCGTLLTTPPPSGLRGWYEKNMPLQGDVTKGILIVTILIFIVTWVASFLKGKSGWLMDVDLNVLNNFGAKNTALILKGETWRLVTAIFLHANLLHIFFNMFAFVQLGYLTEQIYGWERFLFFYIATGIAGYAASVAFYPQVLSIGASGAIMGLMGVLLAYSAKNWKTHGKILGKSLLFWVVFVLMYGMILPGVIDNAAHIGGLMSGFLLALPFPAGPPENSFQEFFYGFLGWGSMVVVVMSFLEMGFTR